MSESNQINPLYNLSLVLNETGLKADVLRVWERRYGIPKPGRSAGGHRLYSRQDIDTIKWLQARLAEGMSIRRATDLWKELSASGLDPISEYTRIKSDTQRLQTVESVQLDVLRNSWLAACLEFNRQQADDILNEAFALYPVERICIELFQQVLNEVGERWYHGEVTPQQEHFISAQVTRRVVALINAAPNPTRQKTILVGCPSGELHTYPSLFLSLVLRRHGYKVVDLGADIPLDQMHPTITAIHPDLVIMVAQQLTTAASLFAAAQLLKAWGVSLAYGGQIFNRIPLLTTKIPAHFLGESLGDALISIERLLTGTQSLPVEMREADDHRELTARYLVCRPRIDSIMFENMQKYDISREQIDDVNHYLGDRLSAALVLNDPALIEPDLDWLGGLLSTRRLPFDMLAVYLNSYSRVLQKEMGPAGEPITLSMGRFVTKYGESHQ